MAHKTGTKMGPTRRKKTASILRGDVRYRAPGRRHTGSGGSGRELRHLRNSSRLGARLFGFGLGLPHKRMAATLYLGSLVERLE